MMNEFRADLHCHSTCSDGSFSPIDLVKLAHQTGLKGLSITDHDTIAAYEANLLEASHTFDVELVSGVEFSTIYEGASVHLLGYAFDLNHPDLKELCKKHIERREKRNRDILERLKALGLPITFEELEEMKALEHPMKKQILGRPHIAMAMIKKGYVSSIQEAFRQYIGEGKPAYSKGENYSTEETITIIHRASGLTVLAHPHLIANQSLISALLTLPVDGIECYYSKLYPEQHKRWLNIAKKRGWLITGGSDFHGEFKPNIPLGCSWVREETFRFLRQRHLSVNPDFA
jgi:predicted metal-dependent phosphoesterase TrpH